MIVSSLYATFDPRNVLAHRRVFDAMESLCRAARRAGRIRTFALRAGD